MKKLILYSLLMVIFILSSAQLTSAADDGDYRLRYQADSQFNIAEKAYRKAKKEYGEHVKEMPLDEKQAACRKMSSALLENRNRYDMEDVYTQMKYKNQVQKLESYNSELGCPTQ